MFVSDKDLRKGAPVKKPQTATQSRLSGAAGSGVGVGIGKGIQKPNNTSDIVETAKIERENRQLARTQNSSALKLQAWYRGRISSSKELDRFRALFDSKLADISKLSVILQTKGINFVPTPVVVTELTKLLCFKPLKSKGDRTRVVKFVSTVLAPALSQMDSSKNCLLNLLPSSLVSSGGNIKNFKHIPLFGLYLEICECLHQTIINGTGNEAVQLGHCLLCMIGANRPHRMQFPAQIESGFRFARIAVLESGKFFHKMRELFRAASEPLAIITGGDGADEGHSAWTRARNSAVNRLSAGVKGDAAAAATANETKEYAIDLLFKACVSMVSLDEDQSVQRLSVMIREIFSVEALCVLLSEEALQQFIGWPGFETFLAQLEAGTSKRAVLALPPARSNVFHGGYWLMGNMCHLSTVMDFDSEQRCEFSNAMMARYFQLCSTLLLKYPLNGVLQGKSGVVLVSEGVSIVAAGVPSVLRSQVLSLCDSNFTRKCYHRALLPLRTDLSTLADASTLRDISETLTQNSVRLLGDELMEAQEEQRWFSSKWARKILSSVSMSSSPKTKGSSSTRTADGGSSAKAGSGSSTDGIADTLLVSQLPTLPPANETYGPFDPELLASLSKLWALILPPAAVSASPDSVSYRNLAALTFSTRVVDRLWVALNCFRFNDEITSSVELSSPSTSSSSSSSSSSAAASGAGSGDSGFSFAGLFSFFGSSSSSSSSSSSASKRCTESSSSSSSLSKSRSQNPLLEFASRFDVNRMSATSTFCVLGSFCAVLRMALVALDDGELYGQGRPIALHQMVPLIIALKSLLFRVVEVNPSALQEQADKQQSQSASAALLLRQSTLKCISLVLADLHSRWARKPFCSSSVWEVEATASLRTQLRQGTPFAVTLLDSLPWSVGFLERMRWFREIVDADRLSIQGSNDVMLGGPRSRGVPVRVRRANAAEDGLRALEQIGANIKDRVVVRYVNEWGEEEAGIDAGGLFKDFLTDMGVRIFDPSYGLFVLSTSQTLFPNPAANLLFGRDADGLYLCAGRVLGKALFENITLQPQFAHFFLSFMNGHYNYINLINDLSTLDPELYKNLMFLKTYEGDISDLCLSFSVVDNALGSTKEIELFPGGSSVAVTSQNRHRYISLVAKYYLHDRLRSQAANFFRGLHEVISPTLLKPFCAPELQVLISGAKTGINVADLRANTIYAGYTGLEANVSRFWRVVESFTDAERAQLLRFVTACERPPSLGFAALRPQFTLQRVECTDDSRLPTASTCFNILKLPIYSSESVLKAKLLTSIRSGAGFDLS